MHSQNQNDRPQFSGHETFPLRYGWLKKVYDAVTQNENQTDNKYIFRDELATARFGVGKNMVASMRHWGKATGVVREQRGCNSIQTTEFGRMIFGQNGVDPFMERPATLWLLHWKLANKPRITTWYWSFNVFAGMTFERETLVQGLLKQSAVQGGKSVSTNTIKRDVECFIRTYVARNYLNESIYEDLLESPLTELGLIRSIGRRDGFQFMRGQKSTLGEWILVFAITDFWSRFPESNTLPLESILYEQGSPGRVFLLNEDNLVERLIDIEDMTAGEVRWSETAGMRQLIRTNQFTQDFKLELIRNEY